MKIEYEKTYVLTTQENEVVDTYMRWLSCNPNPCDNCQARIANKCEGYSIWDNIISEGEECEKAIKWIDKGMLERASFDNLDDDDFKVFLENRYNYMKAEKNKDEADAIFKIAKTKYAKQENVPRVKVKGPSEKIFVDGVKIYNLWK